MAESGILRRFSYTAKGIMMQATEMPEQPDNRVSVREVFAIDSDLQVPAFAERSHLIFKAADEGWRKSRRNITALLKTPHFREGLDGAALDWARTRMLQRDSTRRILFVISDGSPMDSATNLANDEFYLDDHLKNMVEKFDGRNSIEIYGIGVGLSLTPYYRHCLAIDLSESLSNTVFTQILQTVVHAQCR